MGRDKAADLAAGQQVVDTEVAFVGVVLDQRQVLWSLADDLADQRERGARYAEAAHHHGGAVADARYRLRDRHALVGQDHAVLPASAWKASPVTDIGRSPWAPKPRRS